MGAEAPWSSADAVVVRHAPGLWRASLGAVFAALLSVWPPLVGLSPTWTELLSLVAVAATAALSLRLHAGSVAGGEGPVSADARGVHRGGTCLLPRDAIAYGFVEAVRGGARVKLFDAGHGLRLELRVGDEGDGRAVLQALGLDAGQRVAPFFAASAVGGVKAGGAALGLTLVVWKLLSASGLGHRSSSVWVDEALTVLIGVFPVLAMLAWATLATVPTRVQVGADGVAVRWLRRRRFIPYRGIARVVPAFGQVRLVLTDGTTVRLRGRRRSFTPQAAGEHRAMVARLASELEAHVAQARVQETLAQLPEPRHQDGEGWMRELDALAVGTEGSYRRAVVTDESLWRVVEDASLDEKTRAGAAVALRKLLDEAGRTRLRVVAESVASPRLRVALEAATGDDDAPLRESLDELVAPEGTAQRRRARGA